MTPERAGTVFRGMVRAGREGLFAPRMGQKVALRAAAEWFVFRIESPGSPCGATGDNKHESPTGNGGIFA